MFVEGLDVVGFCVERIMWNIWVVVVMVVTSGLSLLLRERGILDLESLVTLYL